jgi:hypothetical protein
MCAVHAAARYRQSRVTGPSVVGSIVGIHAGLWLAAWPVVAASASIELALVTTVILTALFGTPHFSSRAFRLLPWTAPLYPQEIDITTADPSNEPDRNRAAE